MIISSWNVNSVRARIKNITDYIKKNSPDILMIQEIKTEEINFPFDVFNKLKYESYVFGQKSYNGVAFLSKVDMDERLEATTGMHKVIAVGMGCMLVNIKVYESMTKPYFGVEWNEDYTSLDSVEISVLSAT